MLLEAKFQEARHVGTPLLDKNEWKEITIFDSSSPFGCISDASASGTGFVITHLTKGSNNYIAIVSHDPYNEQDITLSFVSGSNWKEITFGNPSDFEKNRRQTVSGITGAASGSISRKLKPGEMILISY